jgi:predicted nucleotidyltransferase
MVNMQSGDHRVRALEIVTAVARWAKSQQDIRGVALVGSHARNAAHPDSDIDLVFLCNDPHGFRNTSWLLTIPWSGIGLEPIKWSDEEYGALWARRTWFRPEYEVEFGFTSTSWADVAPVDLGTCEVVSAGLEIWYDPDGVFEKLMTAMGNP